MKPLLEPHDPKNPDMSPEAIDGRPREVSRLYKLGMALRNPTWIWRGNITEAQITASQNAFFAVTTNETSSLAN